MVQNGQGHAQHNDNEASQDYRPVRVEALAANAREVQPHRQAESEDKNTRHLGKVRPM